MPKKNCSFTASKSKWNHLHSYRSCNGIRGRSEKIYVVGLNTSLFNGRWRHITAWLLLRQADIAAEKLPNAGKDSDFYTGKIASAKFFVTNFLHKSLPTV